MKRYIINTDNQDVETIQVTMYLQPIFYVNSEVFGAVSFDPKFRKYSSDNPSRIIDGPLSGPGEELQPPIRDEWNSFVEDCKSIIKDQGFTIISSTTSETSKKSEYVIMIGIENTLCGRFVFDLRISDHPFSASFPEEAKDEALKYLKMNKILDGSATKAGIDFQVVQVLVGSVKNDSWERALNRLYALLRRLRFKVRSRLNSEERD